MKDKKLLFKLEIFEGPLDLLLHLIEKDKLNIYDIPIVEITDQYIKYLDQMETYDLEISSEFLIMASTLLYIKSKMLLPKVEDNEENEDPRQELVDKLVEYKKYKKISKDLSERAQKHMGMFFKEPDDIVNEIETTYELPNLTAEKLINAFNRLIVKRERKMPPSKESFSELVKPVNISIEEKSDDIINMFKNINELSFIELFKSEKTKIEIIVKFIALLELIKTGIVKVIHNDSSDKIFITLCTRNNIGRG